MKLTILGATGNSGQRLTREALARGHEVVAPVRDVAKLVGLFPGAQGLTAVAADLLDPQSLVPHMRGADCVIQAAGYAWERESFAAISASVLGAAVAALPSGGRYWLFGGAAALDVPGTNMTMVDVKIIPRIYEAHITNWKGVAASCLDWSMLCPGPMIPAADGKARDGLRISTDTWPVDPPRIPARFLPPLALALAFKRCIPEMTISYEDAAKVMLDNLGPHGPMSMKRVGVALPRGVTAFKDV